MYLTNFHYTLDDMVRSKLCTRTGGGKKRGLSADAQGGGGVPNRERAVGQVGTKAEVPAFHDGDYVCVTVGKKNYVGQVREVNAVHAFKKGKGPETMDYRCAYWLDNKSSMNAFLLKDKVSTIAEEQVPSYNKRGNLAKK